MLCWGDNLCGRHIIFHINNEAVYNTLKLLSIQSALTMEILQQLLALLCRLNFSFSSVWLFFSDNAIADAASRFAYTCLFQLAPHLNKQPSFKRLRLGGTSTTPYGPKPLCSIFGTVLHQAPAQGTTPNKQATLNLSSSTPCITLMAPSSLCPSWPSCPGAPASAGVFSPKPSSHTSVQSVPCMSTWTSHSQHVSPPSCNGSSGGSSGTKGSATGNQSSLSRSLCSWTSSTDLSLEPTDMLPVALPTPACCTVANSPPNRRAQNSTPGIYLSRKLVQFQPSLEHGTHIILTLPASKANPFWRGISITIAAAPGQQSCLVAALKLLFERSRAVPARWGVLSFQRHSWHCAAPWCFHSGHPSRPSHCRV